MPKIKTHRGAAKRYRITGTGKIRRRKANRSHLLEKKSSRAHAPPRPRRRGHRRRQEARRAPARPRIIAGTRKVEEERAVMARVKRSVHRRSVAAPPRGGRGLLGSRSRHLRAANEQVMHSGQYAYRDRRARKGQFRRLWIVRINAACREHDMSYSQFVAGSEGRRHRGRPQDPRRPRCPRLRGVRCARRCRREALEAA